MIRILILKSCKEYFAKIHLKIRSAFTTTQDTKPSTHTIPLKTCMKKIIPNHDKNIQQKYPNKQ